ncbi:hypothetical protein KEM48_005908 [Puccinia striiformis f. sp. tritici PST-130]|nr:hypothetical protein KEM48_005908 [Puccinia striiformis f. sp. tritici PST-130]
MPLDIGQRQKADLTLYDAPILSNPNDLQPQEEHCALSRIQTHSSRLHTSRHVVKMEDKAAQIKSNCPSSSKGIPCKGCQVTKDGKNWCLKCHCGKGGSILLTNGRLQGAQRHWEGTKCDRNTTLLKTSIPITAYFSKRPAESDIAKPVAKVQIQEVFCRAYHGAPPRHEICLRLFNTTHDSELSQTNQKLLQDTINQEATWEIQRHSGWR